MFKFLKKDSLTLGVSLGIIVPAVLYAILYYVAILIKTEIFAKSIDSSIQLVAIFMNLFVFRYYLLKVKFDKTGRGILLSTFLFAIMYFIMFFSKQG